MVEVPRLDWWARRFDGCSEAFALDGWNGASFAVRFIPNADPPFTGIDHPAIEVTHPTIGQWIHVVEVRSASVPSLDLPWIRAPSGGAWQLIDAARESRDAGAPFYDPPGSPPSFGDNPWWQSPPLFENPGGIHWAGTIYGCEVHGSRIAAAGAIRWGWSLLPGDARRSAVRPTALSRAIWDAHRRLLDGAFPNWVFA